MRILRNYILMVLLTVAPLISAYTAECIAAAHGSTVDEAGEHPCIIHGVDVGPLLSIMFNVGWLALATIPFGCATIIEYTTQQLAKLFPRKKHSAAGQSTPPRA